MSQKHSWISPFAQQMYGTRSRNTPEGIAELVIKLSPRSPTRITIEATGGSEREVAVALTTQNWAVAVVNPRHARSFARALGLLAKTDRLMRRWWPCLASG